MTSLVEITTTPAKVLDAQRGRELLILQSDEDPETGGAIYISFGAAAMTEGETPAPTGYRLDPGEKLILDNSTPLVKQQEVWAVTATGTADLRITAH